MLSDHPCKTLDIFDTQASYEAAIKENPDNRNTDFTGNRQKRGVATHSKFWASHRTLKIAFLEPPSHAHRQAAIAAIKQWQPSINLTLEFADDASGDIRISMEAPLNYSAIGTDATLRGPGENTMNIGTDLTHPGFESAVLHEFGHALGMEHEHQHPKADIPWNKPFVYNYYLTRYNWSEDEVDHNLFKTLETTATRTTPYDKTSIMHYPIPAELTIGDWAVDKNTAISQNDRRLMRRIYPKQT
jgi:hypothetical protein